MSEARDDSQNNASGAEKILRFWFADEPGSRESKLQSRWFFPTPEFDRLCTTRFLASYEDAADGVLKTGSTSHEVVSRWFCCSINFRATCSAAQPGRSQLTQRRVN